MSPVHFFTLRSCDRNSCGATMWARSTLSKRNMLADSCGNGADRGKRFTRAVGSGWGCSSGVQNMSGSTGPAIQRYDATQMNTPANASRRHCLDGITSVDYSPERITAEGSAPHSSPPSNGNLSGAHGIVAHNHVWRQSSTAFSRRGALQNSPSCIRNFSSTPRAPD
jgi:hypothetical protein